MIHNIRAAFRYLNRNRIATTINVGGLAIAFSAAFLMLQYLDFELSYDTYLPERHNIYRIATENSSIHTTETYYGVGDWITEALPEVQASARFYRYPANTGMLLEAEGKLYNEKNYACAEKSFFTVFPSLLIAGNSKTALAQPNSVVMSERLAMKMFGTTDVIGKTLVNPERKNSIETITGIIRNTPSNTHLDLDVLRPYEWIPDAEYTWKATVWTYIRLNDGTDKEQFEEKLNNAIASTFGSNDISAHLSLQPFESIHLQSNLESEVKAPGSMLYVYIVSGALVLILLVAWINYVNLETARFLKRLKEVGIRRIIGSSKRNLLIRFLIEYLIVTMTAMILAVIIVTASFPWFNFITGLSLTGFSFQVTSLWVGTAFFMMAAMIIAGAYPFLSVLKVNPIAFLKGQFVIKGSFARRSLLTFQFVSSLTLMALVVMASLQLDFMRNVNRNFNVNSILTVYNPANYTWREDSLRKENNEAFRNRLMQIPSVTQFTTSSAIPGEPIGFTYTDLAKRSMSDPDRQIHYKVMYIDYDFIPMFGLDIVAGRNYSKEHADTGCLVVTESTIRELGFSSPQEALNQKIHFLEGDGWDLWTIIGVVKDYRHQSVKTPVYPGIFRLHRNRGQMVYYSFKVTDPKAVTAIEELWKETWPGKPFDYFFMDQHYDQQYKSEIHFSRIFFLFSGVAVFVACLGVMGMSLFEANARIKEIGIRKVLGAKVGNIITLLMKESFKMLLLSFVIALPLVYVLSSKWLGTYPEHIRFSALFVIAPLCVMMALASSVSLSQVIKAALRNPVDSLKQE